MVIELHHTISTMRFSEEQKVLQTASPTSILLPLPSNGTLEWANSDNSVRFIEQDMVSYFKLEIIAEANVVS